MKKGVTFNSGSLTIEDGTDAATSGKLVVSGDAVFNEGSTFTLGGSGAATFNGNVKFAKGTLERTVGTIDLGTLATASRSTATLTVDAASFNEQLFSGDRLVKIAGTGTEETSLTLNVSDAEIVKLVESIS